MTLRSRFVARFLACSIILGLVAWAVELSRAPAQQPKGPERLTYEKNEYKPREVKAIFQGDQATDKKLLDAAAKYYAYELTWSVPQNKQGDIQRHVLSAMSELESNRKEDRKNTEAIQYFNQQLLARLKEVLPNPKPIASLNAARILDKMASLGQEEVADALIEVINDKDMNDGTKFYAARGLKDFFSLGYPPPEGQAVVFKDKAREAKAVQALIAMIKREPPASPPLTSEEKEGLQVLRREAVRALALSRYPVLFDAKGAVQARTALELLKVMRNDGLPLPPRFDEQVEAAIGIAMLKMQPHRDYKSDYQINVAAYHLGRFLVDFARRYQNRKPEEKTRLQQPWKTFGARLTVALNALKADATAFRKSDPVRNEKAANYVIQIVDLGLPVLKAVESGGDARPEALAAALDNPSHENDPVYANDKDSVVKAGTSMLKAEVPQEKPPAAPEKK